MVDGGWWTASQRIDRSPRKKVWGGYLGSKVAQCQKKSEAGNQWNWRPGYRVLESGVLETGDWGLGTGESGLEKRRDKGQKLK